MKSSVLTCYALAIGAAAVMLAACGGSQAPIGAPGAMPLSRTIPPERNVVHHVAGASSSYQVLHSFGHASDGSLPDASLIDVNGTLYGTTREGGDECGSVGCGTVFSIRPSGAEHVLHSFGSSSDGRGPLASLIDVNGTLYGTTNSGGKYSWGTVFRISTTGKEHVLHSFDSANFDGLNPYASMIDVNGTLYGTTVNGGTDGQGTVFTISTTGKEGVLHSFSGSDGEYPTASLLDVKGLLYGTAGDGGAHAYGTVFSVSTTGTVHVLHSFSEHDGRVPSGSLIHVNGILYGTTEVGGAYCEGKGRSGCGVFFSISTAGTEHVLYSFGSGHDGRVPAASLIDVNGILYGTTYQGGTSNNGTVFDISTTGKEHVLHSFGGGNDGAVPSAALIDVKGTLYGTTSSGGTYGKGTVFALRP